MKSNYVSRSSSTINDISTHVEDLSHCAADYAASIADPFNGPSNPCIPDYPALMTQRVTVWNKGTFSTGGAASGGFGFITADPKRAAANDSACIFLSTGAAFASTTISNNVATAGVAGRFSNSPYLTGTIGLPLQFRVVSAGLRIAPTNPAMTRGGEICGLHDPAHLSLEARTIATLSTFLESERFPNISDRWTTVLYRPVDTDDLDFVTAIPVVTPSVNDPTMYMGFAIQAADTTGANPQTFIYEFFTHLEFQGASANNKIPSHVDPIGHGAVNAITNLAKNIHKPSQIPSGELAAAMVKGSGHYALNYMSAAKPVARVSRDSQKVGNSDGGSSFWHEILGIATSVLPTVLSFL